MRTRGAVGDVATRCFLSPDCPVSSSGIALPDEAPEPPRAQTVGEDERSGRENQLAGHRNYDA